MTIRQALVELLATFDPKAFTWPRVQRQIEQARLALAIDEERHTIDVVCNSLLCPSRLVLPPGTELEEANAIATTLCWYVDGKWHLCPGCKAERERLQAAARSRYEPLR